MTATAVKVRILSHVPPAPNHSPRASPHGVVVRAAAVMGAVLAVNRVVRILGYGWVSVLSRRYGMRALTASASARCSR